MPSAAESRSADCTFLQKSDPDFTPLFNQNGDDVFTQFPVVKQHSRGFLKSGRVAAVIPVRNEMDFGVYPGVLYYAERMVGKDRVLVVDADSTDDSYQEAERRHFHVVRQSEVEECLDADRLTHDFGVSWPLPAGKGRTLTSFAILNSIIKPAYLPNVKRWVLSDADITNPWHFDHFTWLASVAAQDKNEQFIQVRAAQANRNNQTVMTRIGALQYSNDIGKWYYQKLKGIKWLLTGQYMITPYAVDHAVNVTGYGAETIDDFSLVDIADATRQRIAQIEIPVRCSDSGNDAEKEESMMYGITTTIDVLNDIVFKNSNQIIYMSPTVYKQVNAELRRREQGSSSPVIRYSSGPNMNIPIRLDQFLPSVSYLMDNKYIDKRRLSRLAGKLYPKSYKAAKLHSK